MGKQRRFKNRKYFSNKGKSPNRCDKPPEIMGKPTGILDRNGNMINFGEPVIYGDFDRHGVPADEDLTLPWRELADKYSGTVTEYEWRSLPDAEVSGFKGWRYMRGHILKAGNGYVELFLEDEMWYPRTGDPRNIDSYWGEPVKLRLDQGSRMNLLAVPEGE